MRLFSFFLINLFVFFFLCASSALAATPWLPESGEYFLGLGASRTKSYTKFVAVERQQYQILQDEINHLLFEIDSINNDHSLPNYVKNQRSKALHKSVKSLKKKQRLMRTSFPGNSYGQYIERGLNENYSLGVTASYGQSRGFTENAEYVNASFFGKRKIFSDEKWMISSEIGGYIADFQSGVLRPFVGFNIANVYERDTGVKFINQVLLGYYFDVETFYNYEVRSGLEYQDYSLQLSTLFALNNNLISGYKHYAKDQLTVAKKISNDKISFFKDATLSFGLYNEYYQKNRKPMSRGFSMGIWFRI